MLSNLLLIYKLFWRVEVWKAVKKLYCGQDHQDGVNALLGNIDNHLLDYKVP